MAILQYINATVTYGTFSTDISFTEHSDDSFLLTTKNLPTRFSMHMDLNGVQALHATLSAILACRAGT